tara:strand:+ start:198 stop:752 length:555 start_codon:yes stop_codon:yes gene_type:complete
MKETKETMKTFVDDVQSVIQEIRKSHNEFFRLECFRFSPEDLYSNNGCIDYQKEGKYDPEHFDGPINAIYAQFGEETGASLLLEITPEVRSSLSKEVVDVLCDRDQQGDMEFIRNWNDSVNQTVYFFLDHVYYMDGGGFELSNEHDQMHEYLGSGLSFLTQRLGLPCLDDTIDDLLYEECNRAL